MNFVEWAFDQDLPTAEKLVLVCLAEEASNAGVGLIDRPALMRRTGYEKRSGQRLLKSLKDAGLYQEKGAWYAIGNLDELNTAAPEYPPKSLRLSAIAAEAQALAIVPGEVNEAADAAVAQCVIDATDYMAKKLEAIELKVCHLIERAALFHMEPIPGPANDPEFDPVIENPVYGEMIDLGMTEARARWFSECDLSMKEAEPPETEPSDPEELEKLVNKTDQAVESIALDPAGSFIEYPETEAGRYYRIVDILCGTDVPPSQELLMLTWNAIEEEENKHTVQGEPDAFLLIYPAIVEAAKKSVGQISILDFLDRKKIAAGDAPWDQDLNAADKEDPALMIDIVRMIKELNQVNDPRCEVQGRTKETGDIDGQEHVESLLGYHRRVKAKYKQMQKLQQMGVI